LHIVAQKYERQVTKNAQSCQIYDHLDHFGAAHPGYHQNKKEWMALGWDARVIVALKKEMP